MTNEKPRFEERTTINLPDAGLRFNAQRVGPMTFNDLRHADYGEGFRMLTMPELVPLAHASLENKKEYKTAKNVVKTLKKHRMTGNTGILYVPEGMFVQDNPKLKDDGRIYMNQKTLQSKLGSHEEKGVVSSNDGRVRFTPYNFKKRYQTPLELSINKGIIALVGGEENAEKLAKASEHYRTKPYFCVLENIGSPIRRNETARVASLEFDWNLIGSGLYVRGSHCDHDGYAFGVYEGTPQETDLKK